ncbi:phosphate-binding periplasmic protein [Clostridium bornimense]|uniref:Phosphate-binding protein n=1 Tax=Clostridium bornimense TaxID=1216932 RepID=W6RXE4_9CLOT|nr:phosphate ABC transporter substrate-binding protein [Clostridium bornimense]CDM69098.1 phosphate-binding periplasmic protein [Clostridium bornimense]
MRKTLLKIVVSALTVTMLGAFVGCGGGSDQSADGDTISGSIIAGGSTALEPLVKKTKEGFEEKYPDAIVDVQGGGSGKGISGVQEGTFQIGNSDVPVADKVTDEAVLKELVETKVCGIGFAMVANTDVKVDSLTVDQIIDIFTGKITNWKEVGGNDKEITVIARPTSSGTRAAFKNTILGDAEEKKDFQTEESSGAVSSKVQSTPGSISYLALSYVGDGKDLNVLKINDVEANTENIANGSYPFWSYEYMVTKGEPTGTTKAFIDYLMSDENKSVVEEEGYIPMSELK